MPQNAITLEVLRVASSDVLGETKKLSVATPCRFPNANGDMNDVSSLNEIRSTAAASARKYKAAISAALAR